VKKASRAVVHPLVLAQALLADSQATVVVSLEEADRPSHSALVQAVDLAVLVDSHLQTPTRYSSKSGIDQSSTSFSHLSCRSFFSSMGSGGIFGGGMGGMPGGRPSPSRSRSFFDEDDAMDGTFSGGGMPGSFGNGFGSSSSGRPRRASHSSAPPSEITRPLKVALEDLYSGTVKHLKVGRKLLNGSTEDKVLDIQIHPGWKSGTKIRFPRAGNEQAHGEAQDLVFVVEEKEHARFKRDGNNLIVNVPISLVDALVGTGGKRAVEHLDGRQVQVPVPTGVVKPGQETKISGEGMPIRKDGNVKSKGDLIVRWEVTFPDRLTDAQKQGVRTVLG